MVTFTKIHDGRTYGYSMTGPKWRCDDCGREGYGSSEYPAGARPVDANDPRRRWADHGWAKACLNGHAPCPWCGRQQALRNDGTPRVHTRCKERPDDAELLRLIAAEVRHDARLGVRGPLDHHTRALLDRLTSRGTA